MWLCHVGVAPVLLIQGDVILQYPVLTLGDDLGTHTIVHRDTSPISGSYVVEEFTGEEGVQVRRLVFLSNPLLAQTEVQMKRESMLLSV